MLRDSHLPTVLPNDVMCLVPTLAAFGRLCIASLLACLLMSPAFAAGPSGGTVSAGSATITQSAAQTTIKQTSNKAVVNWSNFSIGSGSSVRFVQPSASSIALNRVTGTQASVIQGALQANGQVWVLNPNGVLIAPGGQVAAGSFLATTRSLTDQQFMAGNYAFTDGGVPGASVVNQGSIIAAEGGYAVLAGEAVRNEGYIEANLGQVVLGGAKAFTLDLSGDNTLAFVVTAPVDVTPTDGKAVVDNSGSIQAAGGRVLMTARAASQVVGQVINTGGVVAATSAQMVNGKIVLDGGAGSVSVAGELNASGKGAGQTGGAIDVNAQKIQVKATAKLDVTGDAGGGKIAIGGGGPSTRTQSFTPAVSTTIASGALLDASALTRGDGGEILVFTSLTNPLAFTQVAGSLIARGGAQGGNGGFLETSGYRLDVNGIVVSTNAPKGRLGLWLLDPDSIEIGAFKTTGRVRLRI
jgi:filamentous hemagglutinin family protein